MQSVVAYISAQALINEAETIRVRSTQAGVLGRLRRSVRRLVAGPSVDRTEPFVDVPSLDGYPVGR